MQRFTLPAAILDYPIGVVVFKIDLCQFCVARAWAIPAFGDALDPRLSTPPDLPTHSLWVT